MSALYDHELERGVLGCLGDQSSLDVADARRLLDESRVEPGDFHLPAHQDIAAASFGLLRAGTPADYVTVAAKLPRVDPKLVHSALMDTRFPAAALFLPRAAELRELGLRRRAVAAAETARAMAMDRASPLDDVLTSGLRAWGTLTNASTSSRGGEAYFLELVDDLDRVQRGEEVQCLSTGIDSWDATVGGLGVGELTFLGSQPGVGKSSVIATVLDNLCARNIPCGLFSLEDRGVWLSRRLLSRAASVPLFVMAKRKLTDAQMRRVGEVSSDVYERLRPLRIDERSMLTASQVVQAARVMVHEHGARVIVLDHLGKMDHELKASGGKEDLAIERTLNMLTAVAKDLKVAVLIAAHLKGREEGQKYQRPQLTDFARTAFIERDARAAVGLYQTKDDPETLLAAVLKNTNGPSDEDFVIRAHRLCGLVSSRNGTPSTHREMADESRMMTERDAA